MENPYQSPQAPDQPAPKSKVWKWVAWGCGGCLGASLLLLASCYVMARGVMTLGERQLGPTCDAYLAYANEGRYDQAYDDEFDQSLKQVVTREKHRALLSAVYGKLGKLESKQVQNVESGFDQAGKWSRIQYSGKFTNGEGTIRFRLVKRGDAYKIVEFNYHSPLLLDLMIDPK
ncbi:MULTISPECIES: DUF3887 domain-containing protein [Geothrix]|uniref:DUF3887 domain-containing protein n=1 Tax=Geothrix TaxID=44675 RepID=UPI001FAE5E0F|nr:MULTISPECIES: DUF3887 domain-containing protein [Geothrix]